MSKEKKLCVVHVLKSSIYSGAENVVITLMKAMRNDFNMVYVSTDGEIRKHLEDENITMDLLSGFHRRELKRVLKKLRPDIVHAHDFSASVLCASINGSYRLISHLHYDPPWVKTWNFKTLAYRACFKRIETVITVSGCAFETMVFREAYRNHQLTLRNPLDFARIQELGNKELQLNENKNKKMQYEDFDLIFVGRFVEQKNPQRFIQVVQKLHQEGFPNLHVCMLGDGELLDDCKSLVRELGIEKNIEFLGFQKNPYTYMIRAKILCITSGWEGFGLVAAEANILGVPVLSTPNSGCTEVLGKNSQELCNSDEDFIVKIKKLLSDSDELEVWRARSLKRSEQFMTVEDYKLALSKLYMREVSK